MAAAMKGRIQRECGLSVSIGIASNKVCAKIAASLGKPNGLISVAHGKEKEFLAPLPIEMVPGVGTRTLPKMHTQGIFTIADILSPGSVIRNPQSALCRYLTAVANGEDKHVMQYDRVEKSISRDTTFGRDTSNTKFITSTLYYLAERCCKTLRKRNQVASTVTVKVRFADFTTVQKQTTLSIATANEEGIFSAAQRMLNDLLRPNCFIRLVGVKVSNLSSSEEIQMQLDVVRSEKISNLHRRLDGLQAKHGYVTIQWGFTYALHDRFDAGDDGYRLHSPVYGL